MLNNSIKIAKSTGVDLPIMYVYLAGRISGDVIDKCIAWRKEIVNFYKDYKGQGAYPIAFIDPLNSGEAESVDKKGLTSNIPPNLIYDKDLLSVHSANVVVANMDDYFEERLNLNNISYNDTMDRYNLIERYQELHNAVINRRENIGTVMEVAWALYLQKPVILIVPEKRKEIFEKHPFTRRASVIVSSVDELLEGKYLQLLYKSIASATY